MRIPSAYRLGYRKALALDPDTAENFIAHTTIGDPVMDAMVEDLAPLPQKEIHRFINAGMEEDYDVLKDAPSSLRDFFVNSPPPAPDWLDYRAFVPGIRAFQKNSDTILLAFISAVLIYGFTTQISRAFVHTGRIFDNGVRRLKQNNRHQLEIFLPGGLHRYGDGWKLSVRIRFIHARIRRLLSQSPEWDHTAWGVPISSAHVGFATACFASRSVKYSSSLGAHYSSEERASIHDVWRYTGYLMGVPETILYRDENHAGQIIEIGSICEPPPTDDSIIMANALVNSAPLVADINDPESRRVLVSNTIYPLARSLIGKDLADQLQFPPSKRPGLLFWYKMRRHIRRLLALYRNGNALDFSSLLAVLAYDEAGISYRLPDHVRAEESDEW